MRSFHRAFAFIFIYLFQIYHAPAILLGPGGDLRGSCPCIPPPSFSLPFAFEFGVLSRGHVVPFFGMVIVFLILLFNHINIYIII